MNKTIKSALLGASLSVSLIAAPLFAATEQTQSHLKTLLGELLHLEQQLDARVPGEDTIQPGANYTIKPGDSLGGIAKRAYGDTDLKPSLVMQMMVENNPTAFFRNNANFIYAGKIIRIPSVEDFRNMLFSGQSDSLLTQNSDKSQWIRFP